MVRTVSVTEAGANFSDLLGSVHDTKEAVVVERDGAPYAVVISPEQFVDLQREEVDDWHIIDQIAARNSDKDPDAVLAEVTAAVEAVRQERYEAQKRSAPRRR